MIAEFLTAVALAPVTETRLIAEPDVAAPGDLVSLVLENAEPRPLRYGLPFRVHRRTGGQWRLVALRDVAIPHFGFPLPLLSLRPGERTRPGLYPLDLVDGLPLGRDVKPGRYRIVRVVKVQAGPRLRLAAPLTVRRP
jgi:Big-like domain-containing protein